MHGIPFRWQSEITVWEPPHRFVDEQRRGPYRIWRHEHRFLERDGGTTISDRVQYAVLFDPIVDRWLVRPDIERIFDFRTRKMRELFGGGGWNCERGRVAPATRPPTQEGEQQLESAERCARTV